MAATELEALVRDELTRPTPDAARRFADEIRTRHGATLACLLFYGSCLRRGSAEGVLDFYALVDSYDDAYASAGLRLANRLLPPNVFYVEIPAPEGTWRAKYAVISLADFGRGVRPGTLRSSLWARFSQPAVACGWRDDAVLAHVVGEVAEAVVTAVATLAPVAAPEPGPFDAAAFWRRALRETYAAEMRPERGDRIAALYAAAPERFDRAARLALAELAQRGGVTLAGDVVRWPEGRARQAARAWRLRRPLAKVAYVAQLLKTAATFGDWLPYALWKLERHGATPQVPSERQRRHPFIWGWPLLFRALWRREFR